MAKKILTQDELIANWEKAKAKSEAAEDAMRQHFNRIASPKIKAAKTLEDCRLIKESLRPMPECVGKVLLFRAIIITEEVIKGDACPTCLLPNLKCGCE